MIITSAKYLKIRDDDGNTIAGSDNQAIIAVIDGVTMTVPLSDDNYHYKEITQQIADGTLTIAEAD
tara:strand:+ start:3379 stop:3576 length:198 start_codon:yes stop_codon:yes gene_type:complete